MKIVNRDTSACSDLNLQPNDSVYLWAGQVSGAKRSFAVYHIDAQGNAQPEARALGAFQCRGDSAIQAKAHTVFPAHCDTGEQLDTLYTDQAIADPKRTNKLGPLHDQGLWYSCPAGCCQATNFGS
jgi:hypothetical protein